MSVGSLPIKRSPHIKSLCLLFLVLLCAGCIFNQTTGLIYEYDFENLRNTNPLFLSKAQAHSGIYSNKLDTSFIFGKTFALKFKYISKEKVRKVKISFWVYLPDSAAAGYYVTEVRGLDNKNLFWDATNFNEKIAPPGNWKQISAEYNLAAKNLNLPDNEIALYPWHQGKTEFYIDDIRIEFLTE